MRNHGAEYVFLLKPDHAVVRQAQPLSPFVIATHRPTLAPIFEFNKPASKEISAVAGV